MKKIASLLSLVILTMSFSGCSLRIPTISEAADVIDAYVYYNKTGELPDDINEILDNFELSSDVRAEVESILSSNTDKTMQNAIKSASKSSVLKLAKEYYNMAHPKIEGDLKSEYNRIVTWKPDFSGKKQSDKLQKAQRESSVNVAMALSYTSAKNYYLALASAVFSLNPENVVAAGNLAAAIAAYADDLELSGEKPAGLKKYYSDAESIYLYGLMLAGQEDAKVQGEKYTRDALPLLVSIGNLYLDTNRLNEAYASFQTALELDEEYSPATEGLYNTYMAMKQYQKALELLSKTMQFSAFAGGSKKLADKTEADSEKPHVLTPTLEEEILEVKLDSFNTIDSVSAADFVEEIDAEAKRKLDKLIKDVQGKMRYTAPDITIISQFSSLKAISAPIGQSAIEAFNEGVYKMEEDIFELEDKVDAREPSDEVYDEIAREMEKLGITQNPEPEVFHKLFATLAKAQPEFGIFAINPYDYANPMDILVQRQNLISLIMKYNEYTKYIAIVNERVYRDLDDIRRLHDEKIPKLWDEMNYKLSKLDPEDPGYEAKVHGIHSSYYNQINTSSQAYWSQATTVTVSAYQQKIKKYTEQMYNDCMKHIVLISDDDIQEALEERLRLSILSGLAIIFNNISTSFSFTNYEEDCQCDLSALKALRKKREKEREALANDQIRKNMEAKKRFESGILDENSAYYKKFIKPYEVNINTPFVQGVIGPYKTSFKLNLEFANFESVTNHIRNTTTYNGGVEFGKDAGLGPTKVGAKAYLKFTAVEGANGGFAMEDVDIIGGGKLTLEAGFTSAEAGMEASAVRGTRSYAGFSVTPDPLLDGDIKKAMGDWSPKLTKEIWNGDYPLY